jgi:hypothetical protein
MASKSIDELLEKYNEGTFELLFVTDFYIRKEPFYFKVICKFTSRSGNIYYPVAEVAPEELHKKYKIGSKYIDGKPSKLYSNEVLKKPFLLKDISYLRMYKLSDVINKNDKQIIDTYLNEYILKQNCYYIEKEDFDVIIPHYTISNHFHFKSSSLKNAILNGTFDNLYKKTSFRRIDKNTVFIHIKTANLSDLKTISHFLENEIAFNSFKYYIGQRKGSKELIQIQSILPYIGSLNIKTLSKNISTSSRAKFLILGIYSDDYKYNFSEVSYKYDDATDTSNMNFGPNGFSQENPTKKTNSSKNSIPSSRYVKNHNTYIDDDFKEEDNIILTPIINNVSSNQPKIIIDIDKEVDSSLKQSKKDGDEDIQQTTISSTTTPISIVKKDVFNIDLFEKLYKVLITNKYLYTPTQLTIKSLKPKTDTKNHISSRYYTEEDIERIYLSSTFRLKDKYIGLIELEHSTNWNSISTWFFISSEPINFSEDFINNIVFTYIRIDENHTLEDIRKNLEKDKIIFLRKTHPSEVNEKTINDWVKNLLLKLGKL